MLAEEIARPSRRFEHPGQAYVQEAGLPAHASDLLDHVEAYARFLRYRAGVHGTAAAHLSVIIRHFGIDVRRGPLGARQRGFVVGRTVGALVVNARDDARRQRYTLAHELVELLIEALAEWRLPRGVASALGGPAKERLCEAGAAMLLMPAVAVERLSGGEVPGLQQASVLAEDFGVSLTPGLIRLVRLSKHQTVLTAWRELDAWGQRRSKTPGQLQLELIGCGEARAKRALRLAWYTAAQRERHGRMRLRMEAPVNSPIAHAFASPAARTFHAPHLFTGLLRGCFTVEARRYCIGGVPTVYAIMNRVPPANQPDLFG